MNHARWKFRGWDVMGRKGWVYGDLVHNHGISSDPTVDIYPRVMVGGYEVYPESVGLFSGHKDCNGKEIYDGDLVRDGYGRVNQVVWDEKEAGLFLLTHRVYSSFTDDGYDYLEVTGNLFEKVLRYEK